MKGEGGYFKNKISGNMEHTKAVVPLNSTDKNGQIFFIGTCFYISIAGILMTAKHNLFKKNGSSVIVVFMHK